MMVISEGFLCFNKIGKECNKLPLVSPKPVKVLPVMSLFTRQEKEGIDTHQMFSPEWEMEQSSHSIKRMHPIDIPRVELSISPSPSPSLPTDQFTPPSRTGNPMVLNLDNTNNNATSQTKQQLFTTNFFGNSNMALENSHHETKSSFINEEESIGAELGIFSPSPPPQEEKKKSRLRSFSCPVYNLD